MRRVLLPLSLTVACRIGALKLGLAPMPQAEAQKLPACANAQCEGPSYCRFGNGYSCRFLGPDACATQRCAFMDQS